MILSVVIPTYNRANILKECLSALLRQDLPSNDFEIVVVDDGSRDNTKEVVKAFQPRYDGIHYYYQRNQGQGVARNLGVHHAKGQIILFLGDDIIPAQNLLSEHLRLHLRHSNENEAVLGLTLWHPKLKVNKFMKWMTNGSSIFGRFGGHQFAYEKLLGKTEADFNFFYTSNISLKRSLLDKYPFDPSFSGYGWEDIELGYRLTKRENLKLYYNSQAIGYHDHPMTEEGLANRMRNIGESVWLFHHKYPELKKVPGFWKRIIFSILASGPMIFFFRYVSKPFYYYALSKKYFLDGLKKGKQKYASFLG